MLLKYNIYDVEKSVTRRGLVIIINSKELIGH